MRRKVEKSKLKVITVLLIVEGKTEKKLFDYINQIYQHINFTVKEVGTGEYSEILKKLQIELTRNDTYDRIFCIFDGDLVEKSLENFQSNLGKIMKKGAQNICTFRCIENWMLYFFDDFSSGNTVSENVKKKLIKVSHGKYKSEKDFDEKFFFENRVKANVHAKRIAQEKGYNGDNLIQVIKTKNEPFSNIYEVFEILEI